jgi:Icc-related predicted phosphoesterase
MKFGFEPLHGRTRALANGWTLAGLGHSNPTPFDTPGEYTEAEFREKLAPFAALDGARTVLVCHCPPKETPLDEAAPGKHLGSVAIAEHLAAYPPAWFFCGHIHEAWGRKVAIGPTQAVNAGKQGYLLEI